MPFTCLRSTFAAKELTLPTYHDVAVILDAYKDVMELMHKRAPETATSITAPIILYIDEIHVLFSEGGDFNPYDELCSVLYDIKSLGFPVVFLTTVAHLNLMTISPITGLGPNDWRGRPTPILPAPFTELGFDICAEGVVKEDQLTPSDVSTVTFLAQFGRPL